MAVDLTGKTTPELVAAMTTELNKVKADLDALKAKYDAHVHSGITAGAANSGAPTVAMNAVTFTGFSYRQYGV